MKFGAVEQVEDLDSIDFTLPPDPPETTEVLKASKSKVPTKFYIGCAKWGRKDWIGKLYPPKTKEKDFLAYYAKQFNSIEFNGFFYQLHGRDVVKKWKESVPEGFQFCPKFTQLITHLKRLKDVNDRVDEFLDVISEFGDALGPLFLMPNPQMEPVKSLETIKDFIAYIPEDRPMFLELRHDKWYNEGYNRELYAFLYKHKRGTVITDASGKREYVHMYLSTDECFIRFVGNGLHETDYVRINDWVERIAQWSKQGLKTCYFFMHQHEELHSPQLIKYFIDELNKIIDTGVKAPELFVEG